ncbi:1739_t:CDS:1, partial [Funneliformis mosseae]
LETMGVSVEGVTGLDDLVCLCEEEEVSDPVSRGPGVESVDGVVECCDPRNNKYFRENILDLPK